MSIIAAELKKYSALNRPEDDTSLTGGGVDTGCILELTQLAANDTLEAVSDNVADTMNLTIDGRLAAGDPDSEVNAMNGTTVVSFTSTLERVLKLSLASAPAGNVTIRRSGAGPTVAVIPAGKTKASILFIGSASEAGAVTRCEKEFWKNENATLTLAAAKVTLTADPSAVVRIAVETAKNDSTTIANRKATPAGVSFVDDSVDVNVPGNQLEASSVIGVWIEQALNAGHAALKSTYTTQIAGTTT